MSFNIEDYTVTFEEYARGHYIKSFKKKYKGFWTEAEDSINNFLARIDTVIGNTDRVEIILASCDCKIIKLEFRIPGTAESAKSSGNRAIVYVDEVTRACQVLLVYSKNEICSPNETQKWKAVIKGNYPEIWSKF